MEASSTELLSATPIDILPDDVLSRIFRLVAIPHDQDSLPPTPLQLTLGAVSAQWRRIAWHTPVLWETFAMKITSSNMKVVDMLKSCFINCGSLSCSVILDMEEIDRLPRTRSPWMPRGTREYHISEFIQTPFHSTPLPTDLLATTFREPVSFTSSTSAFLDPPIFKSPIYWLKTYAGPGMAGMTISCVPLGFQHFDILAGPFRSTDHHEMHSLGSQLVSSWLKSVLVVLGPKLTKVICNGPPSSALCPLLDMLWGSISQLPCLQFLKFVCGQRECIESAALLDPLRDFIRSKQAMGAGRFVFELENVELSWSNEDRVSLSRLNEGKFNLEVVQNGSRMNL
ncbi:hypothetical protein NP233_g9590 [Leucocoprinus birnbaumii]|uniref:F-box domain-containing protein n=1 Tax=Leucocoprinus birnbaumii TaxID=56174 RepID=A0AAD5VLU3_9AGAR|nr:hypothetical protein NP233_g9590 [Leucocoprinus birnbaumii]